MQPEETTDPKTLTKGLQSDIKTPRTQQVYMLALPAPGVYTEGRDHLHEEA